MGSVKEDVGKEQELRRNEVFLKLKEDFFLPSPSGTVMEIVQLCSSEDSSLKEITDLLQTDPALSAEIINYANSAFLSTGIQVASVHKAAVKLGMKRIVTLSIGLSMMSGHKSGECEHFDYPLFWRASLAEAITARELARRTREFDPDELFVCGLLTHMGSLSLATIFPLKFGELLKDQPPNSPMRSAEVDVFGIDSSELTTELFLDWGLPAHFALAAGCHLDIDLVESGSGKTFRATILLNLAHMISKLCQSNAPQLDILDEILSVSEKYEVNIGTFGDFFHVVVESWHEHGRLFEIKTAECYSYSENEK